jgi:uncharacterized membrane protein YjfL (UPF0719 family)
MSKYSRLPVLGAAFAGVIGGLLVLAESRLADHDSWARSVTWAGIWVVMGTVVTLGTHVWQVRRDDREQRIEDAANAQAQAVQVHRPPIKMR